MSANTDGGARRRAMPRQSRALATRGHLLDAGLRAFAAKGHDAVSLASDILEPSGISVGSFYHQFRDKTDLLVAVLDEYAWERQRHIVFASTPSSGQSLEDAVAAGFVELFADFDRNRDAWRVLLGARASSDPRIQQVVRKGRREWAAQNRRQLALWPELTGVDVAALADVLVAVGAGLATVYLDLSAAERKRRRHDFAAVSAQFVLGGIRAASGDDRGRRGRARR